MRAPLSTLFRLAWRESRTARRRLLLYMSSISLGVAALVAIDSFAANVQRSIKEQSRTLMGGDLNLRARQGFTAAADSVLDSLATAGFPSAKVTSFASMASALCPLPRAPRRSLRQEMPEEGSDSRRAYGCPRRYGAGHGPSAPSAAAAASGHRGSRSSTRARNTSSASPSATTASACAGSVINPTAAVAIPVARTARANGRW